jgi:hypothetical protein
MSFQSLQEEAGFKPPKRTHDRYGGYILLFFFVALWEKNT